MLLVVDLLMLVSFLGVLVWSLKYTRMLIYCFLFVLFGSLSQLILIQCVSFPRIFNKSGFIPSGPADLFSFIFFICCVTSAVVICGLSMYPIYLTFATISYCSGSLYGICIVLFLYSAIASFLLYSLL